jgi:hypothetical protein
MNVFRRTWNIILILGLLTATAAACPFCNAVKPTLVQQREAAVAAFVGEPLDKPSDLKSATQSFKIDRVLKGKDLLGAGPVRLAADAPVKQGSLVLLLGNGAADAGSKDLQWTAVPLDEAAFAYVVRAPDQRQSSAKRLAFFSRFLEHPNRLLAEDAYLEFGHASYDQTAEAADQLSMSDLRRWLADAKVPPERKGFYALALGFAKTDADREQNRKLLRERILSPANDFRAGFDGVLAGYLLLDGPAGLELIESRYLADPKAADGDVRSALKALRFYHEYGRRIPSERIAAAAARVLGRPEFAAEALTDLARWKNWDVAEQAAALYERKEYADPFIRLAIVGYLNACPEPSAKAAIKHLRQVDPKGIEEAEKYLAEVEAGTTARERAGGG